MGKVNVDKMKKKRDEARSDAYTLPEGETILYICGTAGDRDLPFVACKFHYGYSSEGKGSAICSDKTNPLWDEPDFEEALKRAGKPIGKDCPLCAVYIDKAAEKLKPTVRYLWNVIPIRFRQNPRMSWQDIEPRVEVFPGGHRIWDSIIDIFSSEGDITDPLKAIFVKIKRVGTGRQTQYTVSVDTDTVKKPVKFDKSLRAIIRNGVEKDSNIFDHLTNFYRTEQELQAQLTGVETETDDEDSGDETTAPSGEERACFGTDCDLNDDECKECDQLKACVKECGLSLDDLDSDDEEPEDEEDEEGEEEDEEAENENEEEDEEEEDASEGEKEVDEIAALKAKLAAAKKKAKAKKAKDEDEEPAKGKKAKKKGKKKSKK